MAPRIFVTGGTGYIGGSVLDTIVTNHPEYDVHALLRNVPPTFQSRYPNVKVVKGDYDSFDILAEEASQANVVVHNGSSDHEASLNALITGLLRRSTPGFLLHLSGTGIVADHLEDTYLGKLNPKIWSDIHDIDSIRSLPDGALHRGTEKILHSTIDEHGDKINIAIMCPPDIYGKGKGLAKTNSALVPHFVRYIKETREAPIFYDEGANTRSWVHINDLMQLYLRVIESAAAGGGTATWGKEGYYFASTQEVSQLSFAREVGSILQEHGVIADGKPVPITLEKLDSLINYPRYPKIGRYMLAANSRTRAERAEKLFGYAGKEPSLLESLKEDVLAEIEK